MNQRSSVAIRMPHLVDKRLLLLLRRCHRLPPLIGVDTTRKKIIAHTTRDTSSTRTRGSTAAIAKLHEICRLCSALKDENARCERSLFPDCDRFQQNSLCISCSWMDRAASHIAERDGLLSTFLINHGDDRFPPAPPH